MIFSLLVFAFCINFFLYVFAYIFVASFLQTLTFTHSLFFCLMVKVFDVVVGYSLNSNVS